MQGNQVIVVLNTPLNAKIFSYFQSKNLEVICADGGANQLFNSKFSVVPTKIIGDLDSINQEVLSHYRERNVLILQVRDQDTTDFEKILLNSKEAAYLIVLGALSKRFDHTMYNLHLLAKYRFEGLVIGDHSIVRLCKKGTGSVRLLEVERSVGVGLFPAAKQAHITTRGLKWNLIEENPIVFGEFTSSSNEFVGDSFEFNARDDFFLITQLKEEFAIY